MSNLEIMYKRLKTQGGIRQEDRIIQAKYKTFKKVLNYAYQSCSVSLAQKHNECFNKLFGEPVRALINPDKTKQDYDDKILSIDYKNDFEVGDILRWEKTNTYWLIYTQELTEDAYFRGEIRRCKYQIKFKDSQGRIQSTWAAIRGPVETEIETIQKNQVRIDRPNFSLNILMPYNDFTSFAFDRYSEFLFEGKCWRVQTVNTISMSNIIEIEAEEYYINRDTDDVVKNDLIIEPYQPEKTDIIGPIFIRPNIAEIYTAPEKNGRWSVDKQYPVCLTQIDEQSIKIVWEKFISGQFVLKWTNGDKVLEQTIVVESLF